MECLSFELKNQRKADLENSTKFYVVAAIATWCNATYCGVKAPIMAMPGNRKHFLLTALTRCV